MLEDTTINGFLCRHPEINLGHVQHSKPQPSAEGVRRVILWTLCGVVLLELLYIWGALRWS